ncbi:hypothetical protein HDE_07795 [Halotydeus destructor]|nr:hypothetical protein HDE_07795 [Halotydeus destructor]
MFAAKYISSLCLLMLLLIYHVQGSVKITTDFAPEILTTEGATHSFHCQYEGKDESNLKTLEWTWNDKPILKYDFQTKSYTNNKLNGINVNNGLSYNKLLVLENLSEESNGDIKCTISEIIGNIVSKKTYIRVLPKSRDGKSVSGKIQDAKEQSEESKDGSNFGSRTSSATVLTSLMASLATILTAKYVVL